MSAGTLRWLVLAALASLAPGAPEARQAMPEAPAGFVDTSYPSPSGRVIELREGDDLQSALDAANPGDVIALQPGGVFRGPFVLPRKSGSEWIVIRSGAAEGGLPPAGVRAGPSHSGAMAKLVAASGSVLSAQPGAHHYRIVGVEIRPARAGDSPARRLFRSIRGAVTGNPAGGGGGAFLYNLVTLGSGGESLEALPHHIIFDRCYIHGDPEAGARRGIAMNSRHTAVVDSYLSDFKEVGADSQAIAGWNGPGPFKIVNNYLEAAGENVMFGGADPSIAGLVPSDIEIRRNQFSKRLSWRMGQEEYAGTPWAVKNLFELKNARRVLVDGNVFEHNWPHAQNGFAILFTVRNEDGAVPWAVVEDVAFTNNVLRRIGSGINVLGRDSNEHSSNQTRRILVRNNLFYEVGASWGGGRLFQLLDGTADVVIDRNTALQTDSILLGGDGAAHSGLVFAGNIVIHNTYGIIGSGFGTGLPTIERYFPDARIWNNVIVGGEPGRYPEGNHFPAALDEVGFADRARNDYRLGDSSPYAGNGGTDDAVGVDFGSLCPALAESESREFTFCNQYQSKRAPAPTDSRT